MSGINGGTQVLYGSAFEFSLVCLLYFMLVPRDVFGKSNLLLFSKSFLAPFFAINNACVYYIK